MLPDRNTKVKRANGNYINKYMIFSSIFNFLRITDFLSKNNNVLELGHTYKQNM